MEFPSIDGTNLLISVFIKHLERRYENDLTNYKAGMTLGRHSSTVMVHLINEASLISQ